MSYLSAEFDIHLGDALHRHSRSCVVPAKLIDEFLGERRLGDELLELIRVLQQLHDTL